MKLSLTPRPLGLFSLTCALVLGALGQPACSSTPAASDPPDATVSGDASSASDAKAPPDATPPDADAAQPDAAQPDAAMAPPGPTELPAFEGALVTYANGGKFFGYKAVARTVDPDASKVDVPTNVYTAYFDDSTNRVFVTLPNRTPATLDLSATGPAKVDLGFGGADRVEGLLTSGKLEVVEATDKKLKARFYGEVAGVKVHGAIDAVLAP